MQALIPVLLGGLLAIGSLAGCADSTQPSTQHSQDVVLVAGASGGTGRHILRELARQGYTVRAMTRDAQRAIEHYGSDYDWVEADVRDPDSLDQVFAGVDRVISAVGATEPTGPNGPEFVDFAGVRNMVFAAKAHAVSRFVLISSAGISHQDHPLNRVYGNVLIWKGRGEQALRDSGLDYVILRPGALIDEPGGARGILFDQRDARGLVREESITRADVAAVAVECLVNADVRNKTFGIINDAQLQSSAWREALLGLVGD